MNSVLQVLVHIGLFVSELWKVQPGACEALEVTKALCQSMYRSGSNQTAVNPTAHLNLLMHRIIR